MPIQIDPISTTAQVTTEQTLDNARAARQTAYDNRTGPDDPAVASTNQAWQAHEDALAAAKAKLKAAQDAAADVANPSLAAQMV